MNIHKICQKNKRKTAVLRCRSYIMSPFPPTVGRDQAKSEYFYLQDRVETETAVNGLYTCPEVET